MNPSKLIAELQHSARLGKTFPVGWVAGWVAGSEKLGIRLKLSTAGAGTLLSLAIASSATLTVPFIKEAMCT